MDELRPGDVIGQWTLAFLLRVERVHQRDFAGRVVPIVSTLLRKADCVPDLMRGKLEYVEANTTEAELSGLGAVEMHVARGTSHRG